MQGIVAYLLGASRLVDQGLSWVETIVVMAVLSCLVVAFAYFIVTRRRDR